MEKIEQQRVYMTSLRGHVDITYAELVELLGEPDSNGDGYKVDAEWYREHNGKVITIYNYKTGRNYLGAEGAETKDITRWHVGGHMPAATDALNDFLAANGSDARVDGAWGRL